MTWTVTALGTAGTSTTMGTPVASLPSGTISISVGDGIAVFVQYTDFQADAIALTDDASPPNTYVPRVDNLVDATTGQGVASFYCASATHTATKITASFGSAVIQSFGMIKFTNSVSGTPTLDGHSGHDNTVATTTPNSGAASGSNNGDLVLTGIIGAGAGTLGTLSAPAITGVTTPTLRNNQQTVAGYGDASGVTTTTGSVTSTWTTSSVIAVVLELIFAPPSGDVLMAQVCM